LNFHNLLIITDMNEILDLVKAGKVFEIDPMKLRNRLMTTEEMIAIFNHFDAFWQYEGNPSPEKPHALLKSGKHSDGFIACKNVLDYPKMCTLFAYEILKKLEYYKETYGLPKIDVVVGSAYSSLNLAYELSMLMAIEMMYSEIKFIQVEKDKLDKPTVIRGGIDSSKTVLVINELMTTSGGSTWETKEAVLKCNGVNPPPKIFDYSYVLVHRSKDSQLPDGSMVIPIFHFDMEDYEPDVCPYCKAGSEAIKPKDGNNWNIIHGRV
jgi:orotate phosphoribosyltransferase